MEMLMTEEQSKKLKESPELKEELTEEDVKGVDGGTFFHRGGCGPSGPNADL